MPPCQKQIVLCSSSCWLTCGSLTGRQRCPTHAAPRTLSPARCTKALDEARWRERALNHVFLISCLRLLSYCHFVVWRGSKRLVLCCHVSVTSWLMRFSGFISIPSLSSSEGRWCLACVCLCVHACLYVLLAERYPIRKELPGSCPAHLPSRLLS